MTSIRPIFVLACLSASLGASATLIGPTPYLSVADSPWTGLGLAGFQLEDFEDGVNNLTGVTPVPVGQILAPGGLTDSVDGDDGNIDGSGTSGHSLFSGGGAAGFEFTFTGDLPTHAGLVWTDGSGSIVFEAWDSSDVSMGTVVGSHADGGFSGQTAEDRFYGAINMNGIKRIKILNSSGGIEIDHIQFGGNAVPEPATMTILGLGALAVWKRRRSAR